jgi:ankyrin repeat protein
MELLTIIIRLMVIEYDFEQNCEILMLFIVGETPLLVAVKNNDEIMMQFLLDLGAHPDVTDFKV